MAESDFIIELRGVTKYFEETCALHNINLQIQNGEFLTLLGPSGCGKTTILRILSGFEQPTRGDVFINGVCVNGMPPESRQVNTVFQNYALFPHMSVFDNVAFGLKMQRRPQVEIEHRVREALRMVHLEGFAKRSPRQLSGGQQQRVAIARAVINNPLVLLLDEPFSALDFKLRKQMQAEIKQLQRMLGITFVFVTHDQEEAFTMSDRVVVLQEGRIEQIGSPQEVYEEPENLFVARFVGDINILPGTITACTSLGVYLADLGGTVFEIRSKKELAAGDQVQVLLRPEDLRVYSLFSADGGELSNPIEGPHLVGQIAESYYKGATVDMVITLPDGRKLMASEFFNEDDVEIHYNLGEKVAVTWVQGWEVVLEDDE